MKNNKNTKFVRIVAAVVGISAMSVWGVSQAIADEKANKEEHADHDHDHEGHDHGEKVAGPNGGRVIQAVEPHLEFLVMEDRKIRISALNDDNKVVPIGAQEVTFVGGSRTAPTRLSFTKEDGYLVSDGVLPEGKNFPAFVNIKVDADSDAVLERFQLDLNKCPTCKYLEYACTCDHSHDHEGHDHEGHDHEGHDHGKKPESSLKKSNGSLKK